jgi:nicotinate-nucleotide adenylyltransferase
MRIGVMGGSFDPPHDGHIALARHAARQLGLDHVVLVPVGTPPHKPDGPAMSAERRFAMVQAAVAADSDLEASRIEIDRTGPSYTADTMEAMAAQHPDAALWFILGADQLAGFGEWNRPDRIVQLARLAVARRPGAADPRAGDIGGTVVRGHVDVVEMPEVPVSSTMVRARLSRGEGVRDLVPDSVADMLEAGPSS